MKFIEMLVLTHTTTGTLDNTATIASINGCCVADLLSECVSHIRVLDYGVNFLDPVSPPTCFQLLQSMYGLKGLLMGNLFSIRKEPSQQGKILKKTRVALQVELLYKIMNRGPSNYTNVEERYHVF